jgi:hypothetical protein
VIRALTVCAAVVFAGCLDRLGPDVGPLAAPGTDGPACMGDSDPANAVSFRTDLQDGVFRRAKCNDCHTNNGSGANQSGLDLSTYTTLRTGGGRSGASIVVNGDPCASILVQKIETSPPFGRRMPYNGPPYLSAADIALVRDWIAEGAHDN